MGMDLFGLNPASESGEHFRANVWRWKPLWDYTCAVASSVLSSLNCRVGQYNYSEDRHEISAEKAKAIAAILRQKIETGEAKKYEDVYQPETDTPEAKLEARLIASGIAVIGGPHSFSVEHLQEFADFCDQSGGFMVG